MVEMRSDRVDGGAPGEAPGRLTRNDVVRLLGTPDESMGSVNEARLEVEQGIEFNEKWVYDRPRHEPAHPRARVVYWNRYDFVAAARIEQSGQWVRESAAELATRKPAGGGH